MKTKVFALALSVSSLAGSQGLAAPRTYCEDAAIEHALKTAPGIDDSSEASLVEAKVESVKRISGGQLETYVITTEDQVGEAKARIEMKATNLPRLDDEVLRIPQCEVLDKTWADSLAY